VQGGVLVSILSQDEPVGLASSFKAVTLQIQVLFQKFYTPDKSGSRVPHRLHMSTLKNDATSVFHAHHLKDIDELFSDSCKYVVSGKLPSESFDLINTRVFAVRKQATAVSCRLSFSAAAP